MDDLDPWEEEAREIFGQTSEATSDSAPLVQEPVVVPSEDGADESIPVDDESSDETIVPATVPVQSLVSDSGRVGQVNVPVKTGEQTGFLVGKKSGEFVIPHEKKVIAWNNKGVALSRLGKYHEAIEAYDQALQIDPDYSSAWNNKGVVLSRLGKYHEAIEAFDRALRIRSVVRS